MKTHKTSRILLNLRRLAAGLLCLLVFVIAGGNAWADIDIDKSGVKISSLEQKTRLYQEIKQLQDDKTKKEEERKKLEDDADVQLKDVRTEHEKSSKAALDIVKKNINARKKKINNKYVAAQADCRKKTSENTACMKAETEKRDAGYVDENKKLEKAQKEQDSKLKKLEDPVREKLGISKIKKEIVDLEKKIETRKLNIESIETREADIVKAANKARGCPKPTDSFEVELEAGFERLPSQLTKDSKDGKPRSGVEGERQLNESTGTCFIWHGNEVHGRWYQLVEGGDSTGIMTAFARQIYTFLAGTVGLLSVLMIIVGGIQISVAGTNQEGLEAGKDRILAAMTGLALLFLSSLILYTINPLFFGF